MSVIYVYDGSFEGLLTGVFDTYVRHEEPLSVCNINNFQLPLDSFVYHIKTDEKKAKRVLSGVRKIVKSDGILTIYKAFLSEDENIGTAILYYIRLIMKVGIEAPRFLGNEYVFKVMEMARKTGNEAHLLKGFIRFAQLKDGVFYAEVSPKTDCIVFLLSHFKKRLTGVDFIINDLKRKKAALYKDGNTDIFSYEDFIKPEDTEEEKEFSSMWKEFYKTVSIEERKNERCRMNHMPKRFWKYMCEMN